MSRMLAGLTAALFILGGFAEDITLNLRDTGYRGIWYMNQPSNDEYVYKYSGGLGTYCAKHRPYAVHSAQAKKTFFCYGGTTGGTRPELLLYGINQGGLDRTIRRWHAEALAALPFDGISIGGLSVGEKNDEMYEMVGFLDGVLPREAPRYLMGVGTPVDLVQCVARGVDQFDCVLPTRTARFGTLFTSEGPINIKNARFRDDFGPVEPGCPCPACTGMSRAYLRHLFVAGEVLSAVLNTLHNLAFYATLMQRIRQAIREDRYAAFAADFLLRYRQPGPAASSSKA